MVDIMMMMMAAKLNYWHAKPTIEREYSKQEFEDVSLAWRGKREREREKE